jgi:hypothetical protein
MTDNDDIMLIGSLWGTRFWSRIEKSKNHDACWIWIGSCTSRGYGQICINGKMFSAHRVSWMVHFGKIPDGLHVLHHCDNKKCVNPDHLFLGTNDDNIRDKINKGRQSRGTKVGNSKLNDKQVKEIRNLIKEGHEQREIASLYGVSQATINYIHVGKLWGWLE